MTEENNKEVIRRFQKLIKDRTGGEFPQNVHKQLDGSVGAVFNSWQNERAILYRQKYGIPAEWGTAVNVQLMVFGNMGETSGTGVAFTRDPANGENVFYGEYLINAQGEDVVAGVRTPHPIAQLEQDMPKSFKELSPVRRNWKSTLAMYRISSSRSKTALCHAANANGKRTGLAAVRIAVEMTKQRLMNQKTAVTKIPADQISSLLVPIFDTASIKKATLMAIGLPAGPARLLERSSSTRPTPKRK